MADDDKATKAKPAKEPKADDKPAAEATPAEEPKAPEPAAQPPVASTAGPADDAAAAGTDQHGRQLYSVTCADCGTQTQVPFRPSGDRPVYCRDCYMQKRGGGPGGGMRPGPRR